MVDSLGVLVVRHGVFVRNIDVSMRVVRYVIGVIPDDETDMNALDIELYITCCNLGFFSTPRFRLAVANKAFRLRFVHFVAQHNEREIFRVPGHGLDEELLAPTVQLLE